MAAEFLVVWEIELTADSARKAAELALEIQRDPSSLATAFTVYEGGDTAVPLKATEVDLAAD